MRAFWAVRSAEQFLPLSKGLFTAPRTKTYFPAKLFSGQPKSADSWKDGPFGSKVVHTTLLATAKEEAKALLTFFLKKQGLSNAAAVKTIMKSDLFIDHLVSRLHCNHKSQSLVGLELTTLEIRSTLIPYLEAQIKEHGNHVGDVVENFPGPPVKEKRVGSVSQSNPTLNSRKIKFVSQISEIDPARKLSPWVLYLMEVGMELEQIQGIIRKWPKFASYSLEGKIKPLVEFFLDLGIAKSNISTILYREPQLCGIRLAENLIPTMAFLESLGVNKKQWAKVINRCPPLLCYSVESKLRPTAEYFHSLGVDVAVLLHHSPQIFGLSLDANLKPRTEFFLERGFSFEDVSAMLSRFSSLYTCSLSKNLIPKWEFFLTMNYSKSVLVQFPTYFGYSLEDRIKPRYALVKKCGVPFVFSQLLTPTNCQFEIILKKKMKGMIADKELSCAGDNGCSENVH